MIDAARQEAEVDSNYEHFMARLPSLLNQHRGRYALLRTGEIAGFFADASTALAAGRTRYADGIYSIQEVTDRPADLGFFSHAVDARIA